ncbi:hypothetical protein BGZ83_009017 [Gryganskiella cystojenkinii]|nr:hypothetical protein BGZ83_009017 [Gryganskiella cystojenkinii]
MVYISSVLDLEVKSLPSNDFPTGKSLPYTTFPGSFWQDLELCCSTPPHTSNASFGMTSQQILNRQLSSDMDLPPELATMIVQYLTPVETSRFVCVSKRWVRIWNPILWRSLSLSNTRRCSPFQHTFETSTFLENRFFIQTFYAVLGLALGNLLIASDCVQLQSLDLEFNITPSDDTETNILDYAESLSSVTIADTAFPYLSPLDVVLELLNKTTNMKKLSITGNFEHIAEPDQQDANSAHLEYLCIDYRRAPQSVFNESHNITTACLPRLQRLEVLNVTGSETSLLDFVFRCLSLVSLKVHRDLRYNPRMNGELIRDSCKALRHIGITLKALQELVWEVEDDDDVCNDMLQNTFLINPGQLAKINITAPSVSFSLFAREAMLKVAASVEEFTLDDVPWVWGYDIQEFMQRATNLKAFKILTLSRSYDRVVDRPLSWWHLYDPEGFNNDDMRPWACEQTLERLAVVIQVSDEARVDVGVNPKPAMTDVEKGAHKRVYSQLSRLTKLKELVLSGERKNEHRDLDKMHTECLALSLESGLDMLHDMKEMEVLDVRNCAHRIGVRELEWIHKHWPKLKTIKGLTESRSWADKQAEKELAKVK